MLEMDVLLDEGDLTDAASEVLDDICERIPNGPALDMEKQVHDIIVYNMEYRKDESQSIHEPECLLRNQFGVCDGISKLASKMLKKIGIPTFTVFGDLLTGPDNWGGHAWNLVYIDRQWFHLDITADLTLSSSKKCRRYDYFNLSDKEISRDHRFDHFPFNCSKSESDYYKANGLYCETVKDFDRLWEQAVADKKDWLAVRVPICDSEDMKQLLYEHASKIALKYMNSATATYWYNEYRGVFEIQLERNVKE